MQTTPATVKKSENQNETPSVEKQIIEADKASSKDVAAGDASNNNKNSVYQKKKPYNPANKRYAIPWVTKFPMALHEEIWSFSQWLTPTTEEQSMRQDVVNRLRKIVLKLWPEASVVPYGSFETNLCVPTSDIDVVIFGAQPIDDKSPLAILAEALEEEELPSKPPKVIASAKVPIVKFHDRKSGCLVDISFDITTGIANTKIIKDFLNQYPLLRPLALVIKFYLKQRYLNDTWSGGIGSYTLIMMIISYLQLHTKSKGQFPQSDAAPNSDEGENNNNNNNVPGAPDDAKEDLASMLTGFFELYGSKFDYLTSVISILDGGKYLSKEDKKWIHPDALDALSVEDPQNTDNDVGLACFKIKEAKKAFADAFAMLTGPKKYISESLLGKLVRVPLSLVQQRQRVVKSKSGRELTDENSSEAGPENQHEVDAEEKRLTYNYHNRYKSYTRNNDVWYHNKPPTVSNNNNTNQQPNNTNTNAGADSSTTAQRVPTNNNNNTAQNQHYLPPHRRQQQARAPAPANTNSATSSTVSSAGTSPTNNSPLLAISVPLVVPALNDKTATQSSTNNNRTTQQQRKGPQQNNSNHNGGTSHHGSRNSNAHHSKSSNTNGSQNSTSHSPASTSPRVTSSNNPSNTPVHSGHNNNSNGNNNRQSSNQSRSGSNNNRSNNNRNNNNNNKGRSNHNNHNNVANTHDDDEIKNDEHNFPMLSATKDPTVHENKIAQKASDTTNTNKPQHVNNTTTNGNNGAAQQNANNNKSDKKNKRRQNTVLISA
jgi:non-canonical poly(A) RNA polymerase PAPD5/7